MKTLDTVRTSPANSYSASLDLNGASVSKERGPPPLLHVSTQRLLGSPTTGPRHDSDHTRHPTSTNNDITEPGSGSSARFASPPDLGRWKGGINSSYRSIIIADGSSGVVGSDQSGSKPPEVMLGRYSFPTTGDEATYPHRSQSTSANKDSGYRPFCHAWTQRGMGLDLFVDGPGHCLSTPGYARGGKDRVSHLHHRASAAFGHGGFPENVVNFLPQEEREFYPHHRYPAAGYHGSSCETSRWSPKGIRQKNGMMEESSHHEGAINLSTVREPPANKDDQLLNGDITHKGENGHDSAVPAQLPRIAGKGTPVPALSGAAKRKNKGVPSDPAAAVVAAAIQQTQQQQNLLMLAAQQGLTPQQMQDLQQQLMAGTQSSLMQQQQQQNHLLLQHQQKIHEQALHQLNEQLQVNILQQSQLLQASSGDKNKGGKALQQQLHQLAVQQQQLVQQISQIQMQQRQYLLACLMQPFGMPQGMMSTTEMQQLWKEVAAQTGLEEATFKSLNGLSNCVATPTSVNGQVPHLHSPNFLTNGALDGFNISGMGQENNSSRKVSPSIPSDVPADTALYKHNLCKWPGCDTRCDDFQAFLKHLSVEHILDDRSTAQARVQLQVVSQLESQLVKEKELLQAMMQHLHMKSPTVTSSSSSSSASSLSSSALPTSSSSSSHSTSTSVPLPLPPPLVTPAKKPLEPKSELNNPVLPKHPLLSFSSSPFLPTGPIVTSSMVPLPLPPNSQPHLLLSQPPPPLPTLLSSGAGSMGNGGGSGNCGNGGGSSGGPIRRRVSDKCNLPISTEIQRNREFYKNTDVRPPFTYASLIRQAIIESPHRQLTLNEIYQWFQATFAYFRRNEATWKNAVRHNLSLHKCFARVENVKGAVWTVDEIEFYKRRPQKLSGGNIKSPSLTDPASYNETINATIRAAMGEASLALMAQGMDQDTAQDLSLKSLTASSSHDGLMAMARSLGHEEILMNIKREAGLDPNTRTFLDGPSLHDPHPHLSSPPNTRTFLDGPSLLDHHPHHHLSPPPNRVVISLRDEDRGTWEHNQMMMSGTSSSAVPNLRPSQRGLQTELGSQIEKERMSSQVNLPGEEAGLEEGCVRISPTMADYQNCLPGDYGGEEETFEREIADKENYERELAGQENYERELAEQHQEEMLVENYEQEALRDHMMKKEMGGREEAEEVKMQGQEAVDQGEGEEEEEEEEGLTIEGPQPTLEASDDDLVDNLPVFPVPQLQPVTSA